MYSHYHYVPSGQPTIQAVIDAASDRDTVLVAVCTYCENINTNGKNIALVSVSGREDSFIGPAFPGSNVLAIGDYEDAACVIDGYSTAFDSRSLGTHYI